MYCCVFFFFKQKTAYEMRISDWSSDVCSSDLVSDAREGIWRHGLALAELLKYAMKHRLDSIEDVILRDEAHFDIKLVEFARRTIGTGVFVTKARRDLEIGRASCRERVCR